MSARPVRPLVLASASPRRQELLREAGWPFDVVVPEVEEAHDASLSCDALTVANARLKALAGLGMRPDAVVIGADTLVYLGTEPLGKPKDLEEAKSMLLRLSGETHAVCTGVALASAEGVREFAVITEVRFLPLMEPEIEHYLSKVHVLDKAGAYAAQEYGELIIEKMVGSYSNVVGLPMERLITELARLEIVESI